MQWVCISALKKYLVLKICTASIPFQTEMMYPPRPAWQRKGRGGPRTEWRELLPRSELQFLAWIGIIDTTCKMIIWTCTTRRWLWHLIGQHWVFPVSLASPSSTNKDLVESSYSLSIFSVMYWDFITTFTFPSNSNKTWARPRVLEEAWPRWSGGNRDTWECKLTIWHLITSPSCQCNTSI